MISDPLWQWVFTTAFAALAIFYLYKTGTAAKPLVVISDLLHSLMSIAMLIMVWPWWSVVSPMGQLILFVIATLWYVVILILLLFRKVSTSAVGGHGIFHQIAHAIMMISMVWMLYVMLPSEHSHHGHQLTSIPLLLGILSTAALLISATWFMVQVIRDRRLKHTAHAIEMGANALMSLGMAVMNMLAIFG